MHTTPPDLLRDAAERSIRYLSELDDRGVAASPDAVANLAQLDVPLPKNPTDPAKVLGLLDRLGSPATNATAAGRYFGFVTGGVLPAALASSWLANAWDQNASMVTLSPVAAVLEAVSRGWVLDLLGLPPGSGVGFVTGATAANVTCLAAARHRVLAGAGWDVEGDGLFGAPPITVVVGEQSHASMDKALALLGLGRNRVVRLPVDDQGRIRPTDLPAIGGPTIVCIQAGNVNTGAIDPAPELCAWAAAQGDWVHVDGAFGLWAAAAPSRAHLVEGIAGADSWATDAHKWLNVPYDSGLAIVRDPADIQAAMTATAAYLVATDAREPNQYVPEMSRRARGIEVWAALLSLGRSGLADLIERCCRHATRFAEGLIQAGHRVLNDVTLNQVLVSFGDPDHTRRVIAAIQSDRTCWCGGTVWQGQPAMRISVSSWATTDDDVERSLAAMLRIAREVASSAA